MEIETLAGLFFPSQDPSLLLALHSDHHTPPPRCKVYCFHLLSLSGLSQQINVYGLSNWEEVTAPVSPSHHHHHHLPPCLHPTWDAFPSGSSAGQAGRWKPNTPRYHCHKVWKSPVHCRPWWTAAMWALQLARCRLTAYVLLARYSNLTSNRGVSHTLHTKRDVEVSRKTGSKQHLCLKNTVTSLLVTVWAAQLQLIGILIILLTCWWH